MAKRQDLKALRNMIAEAKRLLETSPELPEGRSRRALELLGDSVVLADYLVTVEPASVLGALGGKATAKKGSAYFSKIAGMRKTKGGGRPISQGWANLSAREIRTEAETKPDSAAFSMYRDLNSAGRASSLNSGVPVKGKFILRWRA